MPPYNILIVDDEQSICDFLTILLKKHGYGYAFVNSGREALENISENHYDLVIADLMMKDMDGMTLLKAINQKHSEIIFIMMTAFGTIDTAVEAMKYGAFDYLTKPFKVDEILYKIQKAFEQRQIVQENDFLKSQIQKQTAGDEFIGQSKETCKLLEVIERIADTESTVLITGESGTGKELIAKSIHQKSRRSQQIFLTINCSALPENLLESELFGHLRGAFTGAVRNKDGLFYAANRGTIFLDEIGDVSLNMQVKLLRALQNREITPVGSNKVIKIDVRIISATNADLTERIQNGKFREDLFYRLNVINLRIPPLRERLDDIPLLIEYFLKKKFQAKTAGEPLEFDEEVKKFFFHYSWPGNVRELQNLIERLVTIRPQGKITKTDLPTSMLKGVQRDQTLQEEYIMPSMNHLEKSYIYWVLRQTGWKKQKAAEILGIDLSTLYRKIEKYGLDGEQFDPEKSGG